MRDEGARRARRRRRIWNSQTRVCGGDSVFSASRVERELLILVVGEAGGVSESNEVES